jgi:hypothetical protein
MCPGIRICPPDAPVVLKQCHGTAYGIAEACHEDTASLDVCDNQRWIEGLPDIQAVLYVPHPRFRK